MDKKEKLEKRGTKDRLYAKNDEYEHNGDYAVDSWFKQRLNHVRNESKKELQTRIIRTGRNK